MLEASIEKRAACIRDIFKRMTRAEKMFLGGPPFTEEIKRVVRNFNRYPEICSEGRARLALGHVHEVGGRVLGYAVTTIMNQANPTRYEQEFIGLHRKLDYAQLKFIMVDPDYFGKCVANILLAKSLEFAYGHSKDWVTDVNAQNERMKAFLEKHIVSQRFTWITPHDTKMWRFGISNK